MRRSLAQITVIFALALLACDKSPTAPPPVASVSVTPSTATLQVGQTQQLSATTLSASASALTGRVVSWSSSDATIATVSATGLVTALKPAGVTVSAASEGKTGSASITVTPGALATVRLVLKDTVIVMGKTTTTTVQLLDSTGNAISNLPVIYTSADTSIALVGSSGIVTGVYEGTVTIRVSAGGKVGTGSMKVLLDPTVAAAYWKLVPNAVPNLDSYYSAIGGGNAEPIAVDLNRDGRTDVLFHLWHFRSTLERTFLAKDAPVANRLIALLDNADGTLSDGTNSLFGTNLIDLGGGGSRNRRSYDLNGDGFPDVLFATNREDGRPCGVFTTQCSNWFTPNAAILSQGNGTYRPVLFGDSSYHHTVSILPLGGAIDIITSGFRPAADGRTQLTESYTFVNGGFVPVSGYPHVYFFLFLPFIPHGAAGATHLVFDGTPHTFPAPTPLMLARRDGLRSWTVTDSIDAGSNVTPVDWVAWNGDVCAKCTFVFSEGGQDFVTMSFSESCSFTPRPGAQPLVVVKRASKLIVGGANGRTSFTEDVGMIPDSRLIAYAVQNDRLIRTPLLVDETTVEDYNDIDCRDVNGDGFDDIVAYAMRDGARPIVYLNDHTGRVVRISDTLLPQGPKADFDRQWSSLFADVDGDGIQDLIYFARNGCGTSGACTRPQLWKGRRPLQLPSAARSSRVKAP